MEQGENDGAHTKEGQSARNPLVTHNDGIKKHQKVDILERI